MERAVEVIVELSGWLMSLHSVYYGNIEIV